MQKAPGSWPRAFAVEAMLISSDAVLRAVEEDAFVLLVGDVGDAAIEELVVEDVHLKEGWPVHDLAAD